MRSSYDGHNEFVAGLTSIQPSKLGPVDIWFNEGAWDRKTQATQLSIASNRTAHFTTLAICRIPAFNCDMAHITIITPGLLPLSIQQPALPFGRLWR